MKVCCFKVMPPVEIASGQLLPRLISDLWIESVGSEILMEAR